MSDLLARLQSALGGAYHLERELGGGGMSRVFVAKEIALGRSVVLKLLPPELGAGLSVDRFRREIQLAASLHHPNIVPLLTAGEADGLPVSAAWLRVDPFWAPLRADPRFQRLTAGN